jgi:hypothetical protein
MINFTDFVLGTDRALDRPADVQPKPETDAEEILFETFFRD